MTGRQPLVVPAAGAVVVAHRMFAAPRTRLSSGVALKRERSRAPERLDRLTRAFFSRTFDEDPSLGVLGYQLLSALARHARGRTTLQGGAGAVADPRVRHAIDRADRHA